ncbi:M20 metallopeptidase family protein [Tomitella fengzijianii]|uniref:M20 metallopeptidase family protein n=1 Tax=Tomitella fengzijianii TaxID=2597660 RepID=UPI002E275D9E
MLSSLCNCTAHHHRSSSGGRTSQGAHLSSQSPTTQATAASSLDDDTRSRGREFLAAAAALSPRLIDLRRRLHAQPEIGLMLPNTQASVLAELDGLDLEVTLGERTTSIVAVLRGAHPGPTVLLRGDMDALPVVEDNDLPYRSTNGAMHACGHDMHAAGLVGAAHLLSGRRRDLHGDVLFMFQPGEEGHGGARVMIEEGALEASGSLPVAAYAVHVGPGVNGRFRTRSGPILGSSSVLSVTLTGSGGHGSRPHQGRDPVPALAETVLALQAMVTRRIDVLDPAVVSVTRVEASDAVNVLPERARLSATVRTFSTETLEVVEAESRRIAAGIAHAHGLDVEVDFERSYPVTVTDPAETQRALATITTMFGHGRVESTMTPRFGSEDFSFVLEQIPGSYILLGASPLHIDPATAAYSHSPDVLFDDALLADQSALLAKLAWDRLHN